MTLIFHVATSTSGGFPKNPPLPPSPRPGPGRGKAGVSGTPAFDQKSDHRVSKKPGDRRPPLAQAERISPRYPRNRIHDRCPASPMGDVLQVFACRASLPVVGWVDGAEPDVVGTATTVVGGPHELASAEPYYRSSVEPARVLGGAAPCFPSSFDSYRNILAFLLERAPASRRPHLGTLYRCFLLIAHYRSGRGNALFPLILR